MKIFMFAVVCMFLFFAVDCYAAGNNPQQGYALNQKYCVSCHNSVADPEKPGFTRDTWHVILNVMHSHGLKKLSIEESETLIDYFYSIRKGIEREAG